MTKNSLPIELITKRPYRTKLVSSFCGAYEVLFDGKKVAIIHGYAGDVHALEGILNGAYSMGLSDAIVAAQTYTELDKDE